MNVTGLNDTITSRTSHQCFRVIVFPRVNSGSAHYIIAPSDLADTLLQCFLFKEMKYTLHFLHLPLLCFQFLVIELYYGCIYRRTGLQYFLNHVIV